MISIDETNTNTPQSSQSANPIAIIMGSNSIPIAVTLLIVIIVAYKTWPYFNGQRNPNDDDVNDDDTTPSGSSQATRGAPCSDRVDNSHKSNPQNSSQNTFDDQSPSNQPNRTVPFNTLARPQSVTSIPAPGSNTDSNRNFKGNSNGKLLPNTMMRSRSADSVVSTAPLFGNVAPENPLSFQTANYIPDTITEDRPIEMIEGSSPNNLTNQPLLFQNTNTIGPYRSSGVPSSGSVTPSDTPTGCDTFKTSQPFQFQTPDYRSDGKRDDPEFKSNRSDSVTITKRKETVVVIEMPNKQKMTITKNTTETTEIPRELIPYNRFNQGLKYAVVEDIGRRNHMENSVSIVDLMDLFAKYNPNNKIDNDIHADSSNASLTSPSPDSSNSSLASPFPPRQFMGKKVAFSIFDGHNGSGCAKFCTNHLPEYVQRLIADGDTDIEEALRLAFHQMDEEWEKEAFAKQCDAGAVGVFVYLECGFECESNQKDCLYVANVGDCRAILCSKGKAKVLTEDHNGNNVNERARVGERMPKNSDILSGHIQVTRAIGDYIAGDSLEGNGNDNNGVNEMSGKPCKPMNGMNGVSTGSSHQYTHHKVDGLICDPHITKHELSPDDEFMIVACDGLWDVKGMSCELAMKECRRSLRKDGDVQKAAQKLINLAKNLSDTGITSPIQTGGDGDVATATSDNISVMVIGFAKQDKTIVEPLHIPRPPRRRRGRFRRSSSADSPQ